MEISPKRSHSHYLFYISLLLVLSHFSFSDAEIPPCNPQDEAVLIKIRDHFGGKNGPLSDWDSDCCFFPYVGCGGEGKSYGRVTAVTFPLNGILSGTIPSDFGDLPFLDFLIIANNVNVTGSIPKSLGKLKKLYHLELNSNSLTGPIPKEVLQLTGLKEVDLSYNKLSGPIPPSVSSLKSLTMFNVSHNQLCGPIPAGLNKFGKKSFLSNKCLCGPPLSTPCK
ncbi:polygalacturonase inhibitor 2-like [Amaranthus tricolor]|uniref:polygalacturonase inhibitor 2-like n=1 Tax=Amaranthus tricolor TaxID=29722 RepID=UPI00258DA3F6|nr:polygalacturonase inhibitor 2-like [Amaranthus tricolor]